MIRVSALPLAALFRSVGLKTALFQELETFMARTEISRPGYVVLDARMSGIGDLDVLEQIRHRRWSIPILMISGHADVAMAVRALHAGAADFLEKPVSDTLLLQLVQKISTGIWQQCDANAVALSSGRNSPPDRTETCRPEMHHGGIVQQDHDTGNWA
ncbi:MAG: response regulator receiver [Rhodospirillaceae bacterium]|nr:MAG: response regulator receiver [Rhodospirillaceae bacterium]